MRCKDIQDKCGEAAEHTKEVCLEGGDGVWPWIGEETVGEGLFRCCDVSFDGVTINVGTRHNAVGR